MVRIGQDGPPAIWSMSKNDIISVGRNRPHDFRSYVAEQGFHTVYLVTTTRKTPLKVGIACDPVRRLGGLQNAHFDQLQFHRFWWLPGRPIAARIEQAFKQHFARSMIRGEWFDVSPSAAEAFVVGLIRSLGTWGIDQDDMVKLMQQWGDRRVERSVSAITPGKRLGFPVTEGKWPML